MRNVKTQQKRADNLLLTAFIVHKKAPPLTFAMMGSGYKSLFLLRCALSQRGV